MQCIRRESSAAAKRHRQTYELQAAQPVRVDERLQAVALKFDERFRLAGEVHIARPSVTLRKKRR
jgi:hypothetical protein